MIRRIGILGGTFDPIHSGHLDLGLAANRALHLDELLVMTANIPPHRPQPIASSYHRFAMAALAVAGLDHWVASDLELQAGATSFTTDTLRALAGRGFSPDELFFIIGADAFADIATWKDFPAVVEQANFVVVSRPRHAAQGLPRLVPELAGRMVTPPFTDLPAGSPVIFLIDAPTADVSSTAIRHRLLEGESIVGMVPPSVQQHIERHRLYTRSSSDVQGREVARASAADRLHGKD